MSNILRQVSLLKVIITICVGILIYFYFVKDKLPHQILSSSGSVQLQAKAPENGLKNNKTKIVSETLKLKSSEKLDATNNTRNATARVLKIDDDQYQIMKEDYFCDLALTARENCELQTRSEEGMEICLKMGGYFTNSRHCGYQP